MRAGVSTAPSSSARGLPLKEGDRWLGLGGGFVERVQWPCLLLQGT